MTCLDGQLPAISETTVVRLLGQADVETFHRYRCDPALAEYQGWSAMTVETAQTFVCEMSAVNNLQRGGWIQLGIADAADNPVIGDIGIFLEADESVAEIGLTLSQSAQGKGHAVRAIRLVLSLIFRTTSVKVVRAIADSRNVASIRMLERCEFIRCHSYQTDFKGQACTEILYLKCRRSG